MKNSKLTIIDVRSPGEFAMGHAEGSLNIPLNDLETRLDDIYKLKGDLVLCCASGNRSGMAQDFLTSKGVECNNGGSWFEVQNYATTL